MHSISAHINDMNFMEIVTSHSDQFQKLNEYRLQNKFCDVTINVEGGKFQAHKSILASASPYFESMFSLDMLEATTNNVTIPDVGYEEMNLLMDFIYTGKLTLTPGNTQSVIGAAHYFQMEPLVKECAVYCATQLTNDNCLAIWKLLKLFECGDHLINVASIFIATFFLKISQTESFLHLSIDEFIDVLSIENLSCDSEDDVRKSCNRWMEADQTRNVHKDRKMGIPVKSTQQVGAWLFTFSTEDQFASDAWLIKFSSGDKTMSDVKHAQLFDPVMNRWINYTPIPGYLKYSTVVFDRDDLYFLQKSSSNGRDHCFQKFNFVTKRWTELAPLSKIVYDSTMVMSNKTIFVCGRIYDKDNSMISVFFMFDIATNQWSYCKSNIEIRLGNCVDIIGKYIYVCGGGGYYSKALWSKVERFDTEDGECQLVQPMLYGRKGFGMAVYKDKIYAIGGQFGNEKFTFEVYDPTTNIWTELTPMKDAKNVEQLIAAIDGLYAIEKRKYKETKVHFYSVDDDKWIEKTNMKTSTDICYALAVPIFPHH